MAFASITYTSASGTTFALTNSDGNAIEYLRQSDISVTVNGTLQTLTTDYTFNAAGTSIVLNSAVSGATVVLLSRTTSITDATVSFTAGSTLTAQDLNNSDRQNRFALQEFSDIYDSLRTGTGDLSALGGFIGSTETWVADNAHAATTGAVDARVDSKIDSALTGDVAAGNAITITDNSPASGQITIAVTDGAIDTAELANNAVTTAKITDSNVTTAKINDAAVTTAKIADAAVTTAKLANDSVTSAKIADGTIIAGDIASNAVTTAKILDANVTTAKIADSNVTTAKINDAAVTEAKIAGSAVTSGKIASGSIDSTKLSGATVVTNAEHSGSTPNDTSFFTTSASDARYFRQDSSETIDSGDTWSGSDSFIATTAAIDARIIDLVDDVGGFVPIANETSFPAANPDINNPDGTGTIISVAEIATSRTPSSGTVTIANGSGSNTVTINGCGSTVLAAGFGVLVETTSTLHTYTFHRLVPKATEVTTVAGISSNITTVANNVSDITTVANDLNEATSEIETVANSISNVDAVGGSIANVNTVATNIASVNSFANVYRIDSADPTTSLDVGDLVFNTSNNKLRVYNGSSWQDGVTATGDLVSKTGDTMTGALGITSGSNTAPSLFISGDSNTGIYSPGADQLALATNGTGRLFVDSSGRIGVGTSSFPDPGAGVNLANGFLYLYDPQDAADAGRSIKFATDGGATGRAQVEIKGLQNASGTGGGYLSVLTMPAGGTTRQERLRITSDGKVGVGSSSPGQLLHLRNASNPAIQIDDTTNSQFIASITSAGSFGNNSTVGQLYLRGAAGIGFTGDNGTSTGMVFTSGNRLGIGTTSPGQTLHVNAASGDVTGRFSATSAAGTNSVVGFIAGTSGTAALQFGDSGSSDIGQIRYENSNDSMVFNVNGSNRVTIDSSGRLLVGTSSSRNVAASVGSRLQIEHQASAGVHGLSVIDVVDSAQIAFGTNNGGSVCASGKLLGRINFVGNDGTNMQNQSAFIEAYADATWGTGDVPGRLVFSTTADGAASPTERMRITKEGNVYFGAAISSTPWTKNSGNGTMSWLEDTGSAAGTLAMANNSDRGFAALYINKFAYTSGDDDRFADWRLNGGSAIGTVTVNATSNGVNYNTTSDYRLKENVVALTDGIDRLKQLNVNRFNFIGSTLVVDGFIAHEVQDVVPEAISGAKDAVDNEGNPKYQGIDQSKLVPLLTAALQEAIAKIETLEQRLSDAGIA